MLKRQGRGPRRVITDKLRSYSAAHRTVMPSVVHSARRYENNRAEVLHQPTRQRERQMRRFKSAVFADRVLSVHGLVLNLFRVDQHLLRSAHHRLLRKRACRRMGYGHVCLLNDEGSSHRGIVTPSSHQQLDSASMMAWVFARYRSIPDRARRLTITRSRPLKKPDKPVTRDRVA